MMAAINKNYFAGRQVVTCYSCHRGTLRPRRTPVVKGENATDPVELSVPGTDAAAIAVLTRCLRATGGQAALQTIKSEVKSGVVELGPGLQFQMQVMMESPRKRREVVDEPSGDTGEEAGASAKEPARAAEAECSITINSVPWSELWIDGKNTSRHTPVVDHKVPCGKHKLAFKRPEMQIDQTENINVRPGQPLKKVYTLAVEE